MNSYSKSFDSGHLTPSQKQGTIILIPKKDKDLTDLKSWRPLSLLNNDYKILAKLLANRLRLTLTEIINPNQIGYMKDHFIGENTRLIANVIDYCKHTLQPSIILLADFGKAFDTINWNFLEKCLTHFGFGPNFRRWMSVVYTDIESCVTNNGYMSQFFKLFRGIRQGCPINALLFLLPAEIIANIIWISPHIIGLKVNGKCIKLCQLADNMTLFLTDNSFVRYSLRMFEEFYRYAGLKLNKGKTEAIIIQNDGTLEHNLSLGIKWINRPFKTLGTWFSLDNEEIINLNKNDIESRVTNNGYMSQFFKLFRGIRQGCPISALLFLLPAEIIANIIWISPHIIGLKVNGKCIKLCQLADNMTLFLTDNSFVRHSLRMFEEFSSLSLGIKWINRPFKTLGTWFSPDNEEMIN